MNSILTLINRAYKICSTYDILHQEFEFLTNYFKRNGFPISIVQSKIKSFLSSIYRKSSSNPQSFRGDKIYFSFPYFGKHSEQLVKEIKLLLSKYFINNNIEIILCNKLTIGSFFNYKDSFPNSLRSSIIYQYSCLQCRSVYVGMTTRNLYIRVAEHLGKSFRTNRRLTSPSHSMIREHIENNCPYIPSINDFKILSTSNNFNDLKILESLYIHKIKPQLNSNNSSFLLDLVT